MGGCREERRQDERISKKHEREGKKKCNKTRCAKATEEKTHEVMCRRTKYLLFIFDAILSKLCSLAYIC